MTNKWWNDDESIERMERGGGSGQKPSNQAQMQQKLTQQIAKSEEDAVKSRLETHLKLGGSTMTAEQLAAMPDPTKLQEELTKRDNPELEAVREALHYLKLQQSETDKAIEERKQEELARKELLEQEEEMKKMQKQEGVPFAGAKGKKRKSIFGGNKEKADVTMENKPADGKQ